MNQKDRRYYENLIARALGIIKKSSSSIQPSSNSHAKSRRNEKDQNNDNDDEEDLNANSKKKFKKDLKTKKKPPATSSTSSSSSSASDLANLELVIAIYRLLLFNYEKYSTKWDLACLISFLKPQNNDGDDHDETPRLLVKWFTVKITSLLVGLTPQQEDALLTANFASKSQLDACCLK
jgi:hypothetical protein